MGLGDELMMTGLARVMQQSDPRKVHIQYERPRWSDIFDHNPRIARPQDLKSGKPADFQVLMGRVSGLRPYVRAKSQARWIWNEHCQPPTAGELYFSREEENFGKLHTPDASVVVLEPHNKIGASPNKEWGRDRWIELAYLVRKAGHLPVQLGERGTRRLENARFIETGSFRLACSILKRARAAVLPEGGLHHAAAALGIDAVVLFGGYISPQQTGYDRHVNLFTPTDEHPHGCGWRTPCKHCRKIMDGITPEYVMNSLRI